MVCGRLQGIVLEQTNILYSRSDHGHVNKEPLVAHYSVVSLRFLCSAHTYEIRLQKLLSEGELKSGGQELIGDVHQKANIAQHEIQSSKILLPKEDKSSPTGL